MSLLLLFNGSAGTATPGAAGLLRIGDRRAGTWRLDDRATSTLTLRDRHGARVRLTDTPTG